MKYIIMCGGDYGYINGEPRQLMRIKGEPNIQRTVRLLRENGVGDIAITSNNPLFEKYGKVLRHKNTFGSGGHWLDGFYPITEPTCFIFGDVVFSKSAISEIVRTQTDSVEFFASSPPFSPHYIKSWAEPFAFKVKDVGLFQVSKSMVYAGIEAGIWKREPIAWELWQTIKNTPQNEIDYTNYHAINDYTCDIDNEEEYRRICEVIE